MARKPKPMCSKKHCVMQSRVSGLCSRHYNYVIKANQRIRRSDCPETYQVHLGPLDVDLVKGVASSTGRTMEEMISHAVKCWASDIRMSHGMHILDLEHPDAWSHPKEQTGMDLI